MITTDAELSLRKALGWAAAWLGVLLVTRAIFQELSKYNLVGKVVFGK